MQKGIFWKLRKAEVEETVWGLGLHQQKKLLKYSEKIIYPPPKTHKSENIFNSSRAYQCDTWARQPQVQPAI